MTWLPYAFFGLLFAVGGLVSVLHLRAKEVRAWIWLLVALIGAAGLAGVATGRADGDWRTLAMGVTFLLFATDHFVQFRQSRAAGAPKQVHLVLTIGWLLLGVLSAV